MKELQLRHQWVIITGASSGLGKEMAIQCARDYQAHLILIARRLEHLENLKSQLESQYSIRVQVYSQDLSNVDDTKVLFESIVSEYNPSVAILNAGVTYLGKHVEISEEKRSLILHTNVLGTIACIDILTKHFEQSNISSGILVVSSMAAYHPAPYQALYSGTKAFLFNYVYALNYEVTNPNLSYTIFTPSGVETEMTQDAKFGELKNWMMPVDKAAKDALYALVTRKKVLIPGWFNRIGNFFMTLIPRDIIALQMAKLYRKSIENGKSS